MLEKKNKKNDKTKEKRTKQAEFAGISVTDAKLVIHLGIDLFEKDVFILYIMNSVKRLRILHRNTGVSRLCISIVARLLIHYQCM